MDAERRALRGIVEEWTGAECGEPVHAQEAYAIALARRMYEIAAAALAEPAVVKESLTAALDSLDARESALEPSGGRYVG